MGPCLYSEIPATARAGRHTARRQPRPLDAPARAAASQSSARWGRGRLLGRVPRCCGLGLVLMGLVLSPGGGGGRGRGGLWGRVGCCSGSGWRPGRRFSAGGRGRGSVGRCAWFRVLWLSVASKLPGVWVVSGQVSGFRVGRCGGPCGSLTGVRGLLSFLIRRLCRSSGWPAVRLWSRPIAHTAGCSPVKGGGRRPAGAVLRVFGELLCWCRGVFSGVGCCLSGCVGAGFVPGVRWVRGAFRVPVLVSVSVAVAWFCPRDRAVLFTGLGGARAGAGSRAVHGFGQCRSSPADCAWVRRGWGGRESCLCLMIGGCVR